MKCHGCERDIAIDGYCIFCRSRLRRAGICVWCGVNPQKPRIKGKPQSQYCETCQHRAIEENLSHERTVYRSVARTQGHRENTYETKHGTGH